MDVQQNPSGQPAPAKKSNTLLWVLLGCGGILLIGGAIMLGFTWWGYNKAKSYVEKTVEGDTKINNVSQLWSDVPAMDGMNASQSIDMPLGIKLIARKMMDGMMRGVNDGKDAGNWDFAAYSLKGKSSSDIRSFYDAARMTEHGWKAEGGCADMGFNTNADTATFCAFSKEDAGKTTGLLIITAPDKDQNALSVFFLRQEAKKTTPS